MNERSPHAATVCVAVIGTGSIGTRHLEVLSSMDGVQPVAIPRRSGRASQLEQAGYTIARDLDEAVKKGVTHCIVATDTGKHVEDSLAAARHGLDVLVEKPAATNASGAGLLNQAAAETGRKLFVGYVMRFSESLNTFRSLLKEIGKLHSARIECQSYLPDWRPQRPYRDAYSARSGEGGVLLDLIHEIDYAGWLFGWPNSVQARVRNLGRLGIDAEEMVELSSETSTGCLVSVNLDFLSKPPRRVMRAYGENGTIEWDGFAGTVSLMVEGEPVRDVSSAQTRNDTFLAQANAFFTATCRYHDPRLATIDEGIKSLAVCDAARRSSDSQRTEAVQYP